MFYRSVVTLHAAVALVAAAGSWYPGWFLFHRHFQRLLDLDFRLFLQAKSFLFLMIVGLVAYGAVLLATLAVRDDKPRTAVAVALVVGDGFGALLTTGLVINNFGLNAYGAALIGTLAFLLLCALCLLVYQSYVSLRATPAAYGEAAA